MGKFQNRPKGLIPRMQESGILTKALKQKQSDSTVSFDKKDKNLSVDEFLIWMVSEKIIELGDVDNIQELWKNHKQA